MRHKEEIYKIVLSSYESIDLIETFVHGTSKDVVCRKEEIICNNMIKQCKNAQRLLCFKRRHKRI